MKNFLEANKTDQKFSLAGGVLAGTVALAFGAPAVIAGTVGLGATAAVFYGIQKLSRGDSA